MKEYDEKRQDYFTRVHIYDIDETSRKVIELFNKFLNAVESGLEEEATKNSYELRLEIVNLINYIRKESHRDDFNYRKDELLNQSIDLVKLIIEIINSCKIEKVINQKKKYLDVLFDIFHYFFKWEISESLDNIFFYSWAALNGLVSNSNLRDSIILDKELIENYYTKNQKSPLKKLIIKSVECKGYYGDGQLNIGNPLDLRNINMGIKLVTYLIATNKKYNYNYNFDKNLLLSFGE